MKNDMRQKIQSYALKALIIFLCLWIAYRLPRNIDNYQTWIDIGILVSGAVLGTVYLINRSEKPDQKSGPS